MDYKRLFFRLGLILGITILALTLDVKAAVDSNLHVWSKHPKICSDESTIIYVNNSEVGVNYQLFDITKENPIAISNIITGNSRRIEFPPLSSLPTGTSSFRVTASKPPEQVHLNETVDIIISTPPDLHLTVEADNYKICANEEVKITLKNSDPNVTYRLSDGLSDSEPVMGDGTNIVFDHLKPESTTSYEIKAQSKNCALEKKLLQKAKITLQPQPDNQIAIGATHPQLCSGELTQISLETSETGVNYQLNYRNQNIGAPITGTGGPFSFPEFSPYLSSTVRVIATNLECKTKVPLEQTISLDIGLPPETPFHPTVDKNRICEGEEIIISLTPTDAKAKYQILGNDIPNGDAVQGNGTDLYFHPIAPTENTTYRILAWGEKCLNHVEIPFTTEVEVHHSPQINTMLSINHPRICSGEEISISIENSQEGIFYELFDGNQIIEAPMVGNGNTILFPRLHPTGSTNYSVLAHEEVCTDKLPLDNTAYVKVMNTNPLPIEAFVTPAEICQGESIQIELPTTMEGMEYSLSQKQKSVGLSKTGDGNSILFPELMPTKSTTYQVVLNSCAEPKVACTLPVKVNPNPTLEISTKQITNGYNGSMIVDVNQGTPPFRYTVAPLDEITSDKSMMEFNNLRVGKYLVIVRDAKACLSGEEPAVVEITVSDEKKIAVNNTLTPNGDGINDAWILHLHPDIQSPEVYIYNIYGQEIYYSSHYENNWKGTYNGAHLPNGAYYYLIKFKEEDIKPIKGTISILGKY